MSDVDPVIGSDIILECDVMKKLNDELNSTPDGSPVSGKFPSMDEIDSVYNLMKGYTEQFFPLIPYKRLLTTVDEIDDVHGEISDAQKRWADVLQLRAFVVPSEIMQPQTQFGIEDVRTVELAVAVPDVIAAGLGTQDAETHQITLVGQLGDRFYYHRREYEVTTFVPAAWWANTDLILYYQLKSELHRESSVNVFGP